MKIKDYLVQDGENQDASLHDKALNVNLRLLKSSIPYADHITSIIDYMFWILDKKKWEDYGPAKGISSANLGLGLNLIAWKTKKENRYAINPQIIGHSLKKIEAESNCGSLLLEESITVGRYEEIQVLFYDLSGEEHTEEFDRSSHSFTIQHEIDHNNGILITDL